MTVRDMSLLERKVYVPAHTLQIRSVMLEHESGSHSEGLWDRIVAGDWRMVLSFAALELYLVETLAIIISMDAGPEFVFGANCHLIFAFGLDVRAVLGEVAAQDVAPAFFP